VDGDIFLKASDILIDPNKMASHSLIFSTEQGFGSGKWEKEKQRTRKEGGGYLRKSSWIFYSCWGPNVLCFSPAYGRALH